jgi:hypothetical protein
MKQKTALATVFAIAIATTILASTVFAQGNENINSANQTRPGLGYPLMASGIAVKNSNSSSFGTISLLMTAKNASNTTTLQGKMVYNFERLDFTGISASGGTVSANIARNGTIVGTISIVPAQNGYTGTMTLDNSTYSLYLFGMGRGFGMNERFKMNMGMHKGNVMGKMWGSEISHGLKNQIENEQCQKNHNNKNKGD